MGLQIGFDKALLFTKFNVYLAATWPPPRSATKWQMIRYNIRWCILFINLAWVSAGLVFSIYEHHENLRIVMQSGSFVGPLIGAMIKMISYRMQFKPTQTRIEEMENFLKTARPHEGMVLRRYLARFLILHIFACISTYLASTMLVFSPLFLRHQPLPTMAVYPFPVDSGVVRSLVFIQQGIAAYQCSSGVGTICQAALMMWFAGARIEILDGEAKTILEVRGIPDFVEKHKDRLAFAVDVSKSMRYVVVSTTMGGGILAIMSSVLLFSNQPFMQKMQCVPLLIVGSVNLFVCAWPADNLINVCHSLGNAVYNIAWFDIPVKTRKNLLMIMQRSQRPIIVSVGGLLPIVSLRSYAAYLAALYSYFTTLRVMTTDGSE